MTWLCDGWLNAAILGVVVMLLLQLGFWIALHITGKGFYRLGILAAILIPLLLIFIAKLVVTETEQVKQAIYDIATEIEQGNSSNVQAMISPTAKKMRNRVKSYMDRYSVEKIAIKNNLKVEVRMNSEPPLASATFNLVAYRGNQHYPIYMEVKLRKEQGKWLFYENSDPLKGLGKVGN